MAEKQVELEIEGMSCGGCASRLQGKLAGLPYVARAEVDFEAKRARLVLREDGDMGALLEEVRKAGFTGRET